MFPAFGFGAQIPPSFQVMEYVNAQLKTLQKEIVYTVLTMSSVF